MPVILSATGWIGSIRGFLPCDGGGGLRDWTLPAAPPSGSGPGVGPRSRLFGARPMTVQAVCSGLRSEQGRRPRSAAQPMCASHGGATQANQGSDGGSGMAARASEVLERRARSSDNTARHLAAGGHGPARRQRTLRPKNL